MSEDEEYAALLLDLEAQRQEDEGDATIRYSQLGLREALLISIDTTLKAQRAEAPFLQGAKGKPKYPPAWEMPVTAMERLRGERDRAAADEVARRFGFSDEEIAGAPVRRNPKPPEPTQEPEPQPTTPPIKRGPGPVDPAMRRVWYASNLGN